MTLMVFFNGDTYLESLELCRILLGAEGLTTNIVLELALYSWNLPFLRVYIQ